MRKDKRTLPMFEKRVTDVYRSGKLKGLPKYPEEGMKRCVKCRDTFLLTDFHRDPGNPDGRKNFCAACTSETRPARPRQRKKKPEMVQEALFA